MWCVVMTEDTTVPQTIKQVHMRPLTGKSQGTLFVLDQY
jgi:hypothetical protein